MSNANINILQRSHITYSFTIYFILSFRSLKLTKNMACLWGGIIGPLDGVHAEPASQIPTQFSLSQLKT